MTPLAAYKQKLESGELEKNPAQLLAVQRLNQLNLNLIQRNKWPRALFRLHALFHSKQTEQIRGIYFYGTVGIGKTMLMDLFYQNLPIKNKLREHFYVFMQRVHRELKTHQGEQDPLIKIANQFADQYSILCFDEFFVSDVGDAMLLGTLFNQLFKRNVVIITTSNIKPDDLYLNGRQRDRFIPTIEMIKQKMQVLHLEITRDYRLKQLEKSGLYYSPLNKDAERKMQAAFDIINDEDEINEEDLIVCDRKIPVIKTTQKIAWFEFSKICGIPRSQNDYLELADRFETIMASNIPVFSVKDTDAVITFIKLIDVLYDHGTRFICSAASSPEQLYPEGEYSFEFQRTVSRLIEMRLKGA